jgi:hypothetical protein
MLFFDLFTFCQQWLYLPLNLVLLFSKAVAVIVLLYLAVWPLNSLYFGQLARRQAYLVELSFRGAHLVFQLIFRFILWIFRMILVFVALAQWNKVIFMIIPNSYKCDSLLFDSLFFIGASLCILIVKMVRRKRGFQDQENQANYDPQE